MLILSSLLVNFKKLGKYLSKQSTILIDARPQLEYNENHILDAINIDIFNYFIYTSNTEIKNHISELTSLFGKHGLKGTEKIVVYDNLISYYAPRLFWILEYLGVKKIQLLSAGITSWKHNGGKTNNEIITLPQKEFKPKIKSEILATSDYIKKRLDDENIVLLDTRRNTEFTGNQIQNCCGRSGRIPDSINLEWHKLMHYTGTFRSENEMLDILEKLNITKDKEIITNCHRGARSAHTYLALKLLGFPNVKNYIGSWHEWSSKNELSIEKG